MAAFRAVSQALQDVWDELWISLVYNLFWMLGLILIIPGPPVTLALFFCANRLAHGERADLPDFWIGIKRFWKVSLVWAILNLGILFLLVGDYWLTSRIPEWSAYTGLAQVFYLFSLIVWITIQLYTLAFLIEQERPNLGLALRNGGLMFMKNFGFSLAFIFILTLGLAAGSILFLMSLAFGGIHLALASNHAVIDRLGLDE